MFVPKTCHVEQRPRLTGISRAGAVFLEQMVGEVRSGIVDGGAFHLSFFHKFERPVIRFVQEFTTEECFLNEPHVRRGMYCLFPDGIGKNHDAHAPVCAICMAVC